jgi:hypothetical protein
LAKILLDRAQHEAVPFAIEAGHLLTGREPGQAQDAEETERESGAHEWTPIDGGTRTWHSGRRTATFGECATIRAPGYSVREELPYFLVVFTVPAGVAFLVLWRLSQG